MRAYHLQAARTYNNGDGLMHGRIVQIVDFADEVATGDGVNNSA